MYDQFPFLSTSMRRVLPVTPSKPVAAWKAVRLAASFSATHPGGVQLHPTRKLKYKLTPRPSAGNGAKTWYRPRSKGATIVMRSVPMSPNLVEVFAGRRPLAGRMAFPGSSAASPVRLLYEACFTAPFRRSEERLV